MGLTVTQRPNQNNAFVCTGNPIIYKMTRKDYVTNSVTNSGGFALVKVTGDITGIIAIGDQIYLELDNGAIAATGTITAESFAAGETSITTSIAYVAGTTGWINLLTTRSRYRVEVELYRQTDNTLIFSFLEFAPTAAGRVTIDVSMPLNEYTDQEPFASLSTTTNQAIGIAKARRNATSNLGFYIKYREVWTGSAEAQSNDSANPSWAVKGARQIGELYGGYLKEYSEPNATPTRKFLTKFARPSLWPGRKVTLSLIDSEVLATPRTLVKKSRYNSDQSAWGATYDLLELTGPTIKGVYEDHEDLTTGYSLVYDKEDGAGTSWNNLGTATPIQVVLATGTSSKNAYHPLQLLLGKTYEVTMSITVAAGAGADTIKIRLTAMTLAGTVRYTIDSANLNQNTTTVLTFSAIIPATSDTYFLGIQAIHNGGGNNRTITVNYARVTIPLSKQVDYQIVSLTSTIAPAVETVVSETLVCTIRDLPDQPMQLKWKNSLGGDADWVFGFTQEYNYRFQDFKRKRYVLFAQHLTLAEWEAINELNGIGDVYRVPHNELTTGVNKSHARKGSQVYLVDTAGKQTGVLVIPTEVRTRTRNEQHSIEVTVELPEIQAPR